MNVFTVEVAQQFKKKVMKELKNIQLLKVSKVSYREVQLCHTT